MSDAGSEKDKAGSGAMLDPLKLKAGNFYSNAWKEAIHKEQTTKKAWINKYHPEQVKEERELLLASIKQQNEKEKQRKREEKSPEKRMLYEGVSKEGNGRAKYLKARREISPTKKSNFPVTSSNEIGWLVEKSFLEGKRPEDKSIAPKKSIIKSTFYRRGGVSFNGE
ncbi:hypothetical protein ABK040_009814 [Willaertia magna]